MADILTVPEMLEKIAVLQKDNVALKKKLAELRRAARSTTRVVKVPATTSAVPRLPTIDKADKPPSRSGSPSTGATGLARNLQSTQAKAQMQDKIIADLKQQLEEEKALAAQFRVQARESAAWQLWSSSRTAARPLRTKSPAARTHVVWRATCSSNAQQHAQA